MTNRFRGRTAFITGGASGIGAAAARLFVREGGQVMLADTNEEGLQRLVAELGGAAKHLRLDVANSDDVQSAVTRAIKEFDRIDVLFSNAGITATDRTADLDVETWRRVIAVDLDSVFYGARAVIPHMIEKGGGAIVNMT